MPSENQGHLKHSQQIKIKFKQSQQYHQRNANTDLK